MHITEAGDVGVMCFPIFPATVVISSFSGQREASKTPLWLITSIQWFYSCEQHGCVQRGNVENQEDILGCQSEYLVDRYEVVTFR
jgi:hypothetical protein